MKPIRIQHGLYKNLPSNSLYNSQAGALVLSLGIAFKLSSVPSVLAHEYGSSTLWAYMVMCSLDLAIMLLAFAFSRMRGDGLLRATGSRFYKICCFICSLWLIVKGTFYFCYCASYLAHEQFGGVEPALFYLFLLTPIVFLGAKGIRSIARTGEIFVPIFFILIVLNLIFLETDMDIGRNFPIFALEPKDFFAGLPRYGLWLGDAVPFMFLRIKNKRMPYVSGSIFATYALILIVVFLGVAVYGDALKTVTDLLIRIAGFNQLSMDIGRMEWTNLFAVIALSILSLSFIFYGSTAAAERATGFGLPMKLIFPLVIIITIFSAQSTQEVAQFSIKAIGYALFAVAIALPLLMFAAMLYNRKKFAGLYKCLDSEYVPHPERRPVAPDSLADNVLAGYKQQAERQQTAMPNGTLQPDAQENQQ